MGKIRRDNIGKIPAAAGAGSNLRRLFKRGNAEVEKSRMGLAQESVVAIEERIRASSTLLLFQLRPARVQEIHNSPGLLDLGRDCEKPSAVGGDRGVLKGSVSGSQSVFRRRDPLFDI